MSASETFSINDPEAISIKREKSLSVVREVPSAMLAESETADRRICEVRPNFSVSGNDFVTRYTRLAYAMASFHTSSFSNRNTSVSLWLSPLDSQLSARVPQYRLVHSQDVIHDA